jgi:hypothetical protein
VPFEGVALALDTSPNACPPGDPTKVRNGSLAVAVDGSCGWFVIKGVENGCGCGGVSTSACCCGG